MRTRNIPVVDLTQYIDGDAADRSAFVKKIGEAFHQIGFVGVIGHGISKEFVDGFYNSAKAFFDLPDSIKVQYELEGMAGQRGYTSFGKEHAKQSNVPDLKEFFQIGQYWEGNGNGTHEYPNNVIVNEVPAFNDYGKALYKAFEKSGGLLLEAIALFLKLDKDYFNQHISNGNSILRAINYPPITREPQSAIRAEQHEDINLITLLVGASAGGLQVLSKDDKWLPVIPGDREIVINVGDMLQRLTNNHLKSTTHRVVNPPREEWHKPRLSIPFFLHPKSSMDLSCLESCVNEENPLNYTPVTAGAYLEERSMEIGLKN